MLTGGHDLPPPKFLQIKQGDKFFSRLLSKETSKKGESSFRVLYYGGAAGSIPFTWESQPGTPKHPIEENYVPPLTPPPSYQFSSPRSMKTTGKYSKSKILQSILSRISSKKSAKKSASFSTSSTSYSSSSYSSSCSLPSTPLNKYASRRNAGMQRSRSAIHFGVDEDDDDHEQISTTSPTSTLRFGGGVKCAGKFGSSHPVKIVMKKAFLSIVGHGHA